MNDGNGSWLSTLDTRMFGIMGILATFMVAAVKHRWSLHAQIAAARDEERRKTEEREDSHCIERLAEVRTRYEADLRELRVEVRRLKRVLRSTLLHVDADIAKRVLLEVSTEEIPPPKPPPLDRSSDAGSNGTE